MIQYGEPIPVKYFIAILRAQSRAGGVSPLSAESAELRAENASPLSPELLDRLQHLWGPIDYQSQEYPFDQTDYYREEMGEGLQRSIISFADLRSPEELPITKLHCMNIEAAFARHPPPNSQEAQDVRVIYRTINLDIGYLDHNKIVLASVKGLGQKIYLSLGIYADLVARYGHGRYQPFEWTFPDFKEGRYDTDLAHLRQQYLEQLKQARQPH